MVTDIYSPRGSAAVLRGIPAHSSGEVMHGPGRGGSNSTERTQCRSKAAPICSRLKIEASYADGNGYGWRSIKTPAVLLMWDTL
jgi:hypothetical protein